MPIHPQECLTCHRTLMPPPPLCNWCGEPTCSDCRREGFGASLRLLRRFRVLAFLRGWFYHFQMRHWHSLWEMKRYSFGFCLPCLAMKRLIYVKGKGKGKGKYGCAVCGFEWTPRAIRGESDKTVMICAFCGAKQKMPLLPAPCARCGMVLV